MFMTMGTAHLTFAFEKVFSVAEAARKLGISVSQTYHHIQDGTLTAVNLGRGKVRRDLRVTDEDLDAFVRARRVEAVPPSDPWDAGGGTRPPRRRMPRSRNGR